MDPRKLKSILPVQLDGAVLRNTRLKVMATVEPLVPFHYSDQENIRRQFQNDATLATKLANLNDIASDWSYINYTQLTDREKCKIFPLIYTLSNMPVEYTLHLYKKLYIRANDRELIGEAAEIQDDPLLSSITESLSALNDSPISSTLSNELLLGVLASLAVTGHSAQLLCLGSQARRLRFPLSKTMLEFMAQLVLEYGEPELHQWGVRRSTATRLASELGIPGPDSIHSIGLPQAKVMKLLQSVDMEVLTWLANAVD
ncbi:hypothetical protein BJ085DRAFT_37732 [Dimargaris cristalligena]|uniref:Uncharacterized protein n=1 Tax=Dimargaris cristalligena TaxID=215637 RepID=A0A4Q0A0Z7_9FUNG|nr:hypothetical protein BJ085DRAFT_37732 [Dimargaris cristalligena]|eukprot:RKP38800.1 hypothetical protein BJ085DRAFT_37732 [Dimargaris cristalligena]